MNERDDKILRLAGRYGALLRSVIGPLFFPGLTDKAIERVITRLLRSGLLRSQPLFDRQCAYTLAAAGARLLGLDEKRYARPMGPTALLRSVAILQFCLGGATRHHKMTAAEFAERFPELACRGMNHSRYFLDEKARLSLLVGDFGADWKRLARKVRREADRRRKLPAWKPFFKADLFSVTLLVATEDKAELLRKDLGRESYGCEVVVVPQLERFILGR